jgi:DNA polymerase
MGADDARALAERADTFGELRELVQDCRGCDLYKDATQAVLGEVEGRPRAAEVADVEVMFVGEQPGDREDREGRPFVGPAGQLLDEVLEEVGIDRTKVFVTNVVKHFKWVPRGKRRIHKNPGAEEIRACRPWLEAELAFVRPRVLVCLGATAAKALLGRDFKVTQQRGQLIDSELAPVATATIHPSAILRAPDDETRHEERARFAADLRVVARAIGA